MTKLIRVLRTGLTSYQIKWIALIIMTIDHIGAFGFEIPAVKPYVHTLRVIGRIAAPLFLYMITESVQHTRNKKRLLLRLYIAGLAVGLFTLATNYFLGDMIGLFSPGNIFFTFFYTALYICLIENIVRSVKSADYKRLLLSALGMAATVIPQLLYEWILSSNMSQWSIQSIYLLTDTVDSFLPAPLNIDYSLLFAVMGAALYFARKKWLQCGVFALFCVLCRAGTALIESGVSLWPVNGFFGNPQYWMIMALPFMMFYNGKRGKEHKAFFYAYYPLHRYVICIAQALLT